MQFLTRKILCLIISMSLFSMPVFSQEQIRSANGPRKQVATIVFSGLAGAVLGLSTLSFYGRPQDRLSNIAVGFAVGVIVGAVATTYGATTQPDRFYGRDVGLLDDYEFDKEKKLFDSNYQEVVGFKYNF